MAHMHTDNGSKNLRLAFFLNFGFAILEIGGGLWTNSVAILSDAVHDLGDSLAIGSAWFLEKRSHRAGDHKYSYGYRRFSVLGAAINAVVLLVGSFFVLSEAITRLFQPEPAMAEGMIAFAVVGILVNGFAVLKLRGQSSLNASVVAWHLLEDVLGWTAVLVVGVVLLFADIQVLDPILSILITLYVLFNVVRNLRKTLAVFLQAVPEGVEIAELERQFLEIDGVHSTHHTHVWSLDGQNHVLTTHVVVDPTLDLEAVGAIRQRVRELAAENKFGHTTVEIEREGDACK